MANDFGVFLGARIDDSTASIADLNKQIAEIGNKLNKMQIKVEIDSKGLSALLKQVKTMQDNLTGQRGSMKILNMDELKKDSIEFFTTMDKAILKYQQLGKVTIQPAKLDPVTREVQSFTLNVEKADGVVEKLKFNLENIADSSGKVSQAFTASDLKVYDKRNELVEKTLQYEQRVNKAREEGLRKEELRVRRLGELQQQAPTWDIASNREELEKWTRTMYGSEAQITSYKKTLDATGNEIVKFKTQTETSNNMLKQKSLTVDKNTQSMYKFEESLKPTVNRMLGFVEQMGIAITRSVQWGLAMGLLYGNLRRVREGVEFLKDLDKDLTQVSVITGITRDQTRELAKEYARLGIEMGKTVREISNVNTELIRQGLNLEESERRLKTIVMLSSAANMEMSESLKFITSSVNALGVEAERAADVALRASQITASSVPEVSEAFTKTASSARATGLELTELGAIVSGLVEVTQESPSSLGNSLKTLLARFNQVNEETGELNEEINRVGRAFRSVGVDFTDANGQIRPLFELLTDLSMVWDDLDKNTRMYISTMAAGVRQQNRFLAIMDNFNRIQDINNDLMDAGGTLTESYGIYLDSVEASANRATAAFEQMFFNALNSDAIKYYYDFATAVTMAIDNVGLLNVAMMSLSTILLLSNKAFRAFLVNLDYARVQAFAGNISNLVNGLIASTSAVKAGTASFLGMGFAMDALKIKALALQAVLTFGIAAAITFTISKIIELTGSYARLADEQERLAQTFRNTTREANRIDELVQKKQELDEIEKKNEEQKQKLLEIEREIAQLLPETISGYDEQNQAISQNTDEIIRNNEARRSQAEIELFVAVEQNQEKYEKDLDNLKKYQEDQKKILDALKGQGRIEAIDPGTQGMRRILGTDELLKELDKVNRKISDVNVSIKAHETNLNSYKSSIDPVTKEIHLQTIAYSTSVAAVDEAILALQKYGFTLDEIMDIVKEFKDSIAGQKEEIVGLVNVQDMLESIQTDLIESYEEVLKITRDVNKALEEYTEAGEFNLETIIALSKQYPQLIGLIGDEGRLYDELVKIRNNASESAINNFNTILKGLKDSILAKSEQYGFDLKNFATAEEAKLRIAQQTKVQIDNLFASYANPFAAIAEEGKILMRGEQLISDVNIFGIVEDAINNFTNRVNTATQAASKAGSSSSAYAALADRYLQLNNAIETVNNALQENQALLSTASDQDKIALLIRQNELYVQQKKNYEDLANAYREERAELERLLSGQGFAFTGEGDSRTIQNLDAIQGKTKEVEEAFKRYLDLGIKELPNLNREMLNFNNIISQTKIEIEQLRLDDMFRPASEGIAELTKQMDLLDFQLAMTDSDDFTGKTRVMTEQLANATGQAQFLADEVIRLKEQGFEGSLQSIEEYNRRLSDLESQYRSAQLRVKQINDQLRADYERQLSQFKSDRERIANELVRVIQDAYRKQEQIVIASLNKQLKAEEDLHRKRIQNLDDQLSKYNEIIDAQIQAIDRQQDEEDFEKQLAKLYEERADIVRQINIFSMDDSMEARNKVFDLNKQLTQQEEKIAETQAKREIDLRKRNLRDQQDAYRKEIDDKKKAENDKFEAIKNRIDQEISMERDKFDRLINDEQRYAKLRSDIMNGNINETRTLIEGFLQDFESMNEDVVLGLGQSWQEVLNLIYRVDEAQSQLGNMPSAPSQPNYQPEPARPTTPSTPSTGSGGSGNSGGATQPSLNYNTIGKPMQRSDGSYIAFAMSTTGRMKQLTLGADGRIVERGMLDVGDVIRTLDGFYQWDGSKGVPFTPPRFAKGGEFSGTGLAWLDGTDSKPERILSPEQTQAFNNLVNYLPSMMKMIMPTLEGKSMPQQGTSGTVISIEKLIEVQGNVDKDVVGRLESAGKSIADTLKRELNKNGTFRPIKLA